VTDSSVMLTFDEAVDGMRDLCTRFPEVNERLSHHTPTFFVRDKKVLVHVWDHHHGDHGIALWCAAPEGVQAEVIEADPDRFFRPPYVGHRGWIGMRLDVGTVDWDEVFEVVADAYRMTAPKTLVRRFDETQAEA